MDKKSKIANQLAQLWKQCFFNGDIITLTKRNDSTLKHLVGKALCGQKTSDQLSDFRLSLFEVFSGVYYSVAVRRIRPYCGWGIRLLQDYLCGIRF